MNADFWKYVNYYISETKDEFSNQLVNEIELYKDSFEVEEIKIVHKFDRRGLIWQKPD
jgi:hypothetical protein